MFNNTSTKTKLKVKHKIKAKDVEAAKSYGPELEKQFLEQQKLLKLQQLHFKCEKCNGTIKVNAGNKRPSCPNEHCLARYHLTFVYPGPVNASIDSSLPIDPLQRSKELSRRRGDTSFITDLIKPIEPQLTDEIIIPTIQATFKGYAFESRVNYPPEKCTTRQLFSRIEIASEKLQYVVDNSKEGLLLDALELITRLYKDE